MSEKQFWQIMLGKVKAGENYNVTNLSVFAEKLGIKFRTTDEMLQKLEALLLSQQNNPSPALQNAIRWYKAKYQKIATSTYDPDDLSSTIESLLSTSHNRDNREIIVQTLFETKAFLSDLKQEPGLNLEDQMIKFLATVKDDKLEKLEDKYLVCSLNNSCETGVCNLHTERCETRRKNKRWSANNKEVYVYHIPLRNKLIKIRGNWSALYFVLCKYREPMIEKLKCDKGMDVIELEDFTDYKGSLRQFLKNDPGNIVLYDIAENQILCAKRNQFMNGFFPQFSNRNFQGYIVPDTYSITEFEKLRANLALNRIAPALFARFTLWEWKFFASLKPLTMTFLLHGAQVFFVVMRQDVKWMDTNSHLVISSYHNHNKTDRVYDILPSNLFLE